MKVPKKVVLQCWGLAVALGMGAVCGNDSGRMIVEEAAVLLHGHVPGQASPVAQNGRMARWVALPDGSVSVQSLRRDGGPAWETRLLVPGAERVLVYSVAVQAGGEVAAAGSAFPTGSAGQSFLAYFDHKGKQTRIVRLEEFGAVRIAFAPDGRLWAAGVVAPQRNSYPGGDYPMLRVYGPDGRIQGSYLPKSRWTAGEGAPMAGAAIAANGAMAVFYSPLTGEVGALDGDGALLGRMKVAGGSEVEVYGLAISDTGRVVVSGQTGEGIRYWECRPGGEARVVYARNFRERGWGHVLGFDGEVLVVSAGLPRVARVRLSEQ